MLSVSTIKSPALPRQYMKMVIKRWFVENVIAWFLEFNSLLFSLLPGYNMPLWLAAGTASAWVFTRGLSVLPGLWLGCFAAYYYAHLKFKMALILASLLVSQISIFYIFMQHCGMPTLYFFTQRDWRKALGLAAVITLLSNSLLQLLPHTPLPMLIYVENWFQSWLANLLGMLLVGMAFVAWDVGFSEFYQKFKQGKIGMRPPYLWCALIIALLVDFVVALWQIPFRPAWILGVQIFLLMLMHCDY